MLSHAAPATYNFTVALTIGPLTGTTVDGSFTFDSSSIPSGGGTITFALHQPGGGSVPEPGSLALGAMALAALGATRARRRLV